MRLAEEPQREENRERLACWLITVGLLIIMLCYLVACTLSAVSGSLGLQGNYYSSWILPLIVLFGFVIVIVGILMLLNSGLEKDCGVSEEPDIPDIAEPHESDSRGNRDGICA